MTDNLITPSSQTCANVAVGGTCVLSGTHVVTAAEAAAGTVDNTASAQSDQMTTPVTDDVTTPVPAQPALALVKSNPVNADEDGSGTVSVGDTLTYTITATNTGNVVQTGLVITDNQLINDTTATCASVSVGGSCVLTGNHVVTAAEAAAGTVDNTASAQSDQVTTPVTDSVSTPVPAVTSLNIVKSNPVNADEDGSGTVSVGDTLTYTITATNTGNVVQTDLLVTDNQLISDTTVSYTHLTLPTIYSV